MRLPRPSATFVIAVLALLLAAGGGAFAAVTVTGSAVNIVDPAVSTRIAHVDSNGHLVVAGALAPAVPKSPFWRATYATKPADGGRLLIEPTAATLAVTRLQFTNHYDNPPAQVGLWESWGSSGTPCPDSTLGDLFLGFWDMPPGQSVVDPLPTPLLLKPKAGATSVCIQGYAYIQGDPASFASFPMMSASGYVVSGSFPPTAAAPGAPRPGALNPKVSR